MAELKATDPYSIKPPEPKILPKKLYARYRQPIFRGLFKDLHGNNKVSRSFSTTGLFKDARGYDKAKPGKIYERYEDFHRGPKRMV